MHGDLCKHLGIDSSTGHPDLYSNLIMSPRGSFFSKKGDSMTGQVGAQFHCDLRFSWIKKISSRSSETRVLQRFFDYVDILCLQ